MYTLLQIVVTAGIFAVTFTPGAPVFPVIIVLLVPIRLKVMNKWWGRETLKRKSLVPPLFPEGKLSNRTWGMSYSALRISFVPSLISISCRRYFMLIS